MRYFYEMYPDAVICPQVIENNWSRDVLLNFLGTDLYERQGKAITNFSNTLPIEQSDLAQASCRFMLVKAAQSTEKVKTYRM